MSTKFTHIPVVLPTWQEVLRRVSLAVNYLLEKVPTLGLLADPSQVGFSIPGASPGQIIAPWNAPDINGQIGLDSDYADSDETTGIITVQEAGLYRVTASVAFSNGTNNQQYVLEVVFTLGGTPVYATMDVSPVWAAQYTTMVLSGSRAIVMAKGDSVAIAMYSNAPDTIDLVGGEFYLEQVT